MLGKIALWVAVLTAVGSGVDYYRRFNHVLTGGRKPEPARVEPGRLAGGRYAGVALEPRVARTGLRRRTAGAAFSSSTRSFASARYSLVLELLDQPLVVGQGLGRALDLDQRLGEDGSTPRRGSVNSGSFARSALNRSIAPGIPAAMRQ